MKLNIELYLKVDFLGTGVGLYKRPITGTGKETYGYSRLLVVLHNLTFAFNESCRFLVVKYVQQL